MNEEFRNEEIVENKDPDFFLKKGSWRDMKYLNVVLRMPVETTVCIGEKRFVLKGILKLGRVENHPPWEDQFQIQFYCKGSDIKQELRAHQNWETVEINFPLEQGLKLFSRGVAKLRSKVDPVDWRELFAVEEKSEKRS